jgi:hypothetical protein
MTDFRTLTILIDGSPDEVVSRCNLQERNGWEVKVICPAPRRFGESHRTYVVFEQEVTDE